MLVKSDCFVLSCPPFTQIESMSATMPQAQAQSLEAEAEVQVFHHLLEEFCGIKSDHPAFKILEQDGISTAQKFMSMPNEYYQGLTYLETTSCPVTGVETVKEVPIKIVKVMHLLGFRCFLIKKTIDENNEMPLSVEALNALTKSSYDWFRTTQWEMPKLMLPTHKNPANANVRLSSLIVDFKKFIQFDVKKYPVVRDCHCFDQVEKELMEQAKVDGI